MKVRNLSVLQVFVSSQVTSTGCQFAQSVSVERVAGSDTQMFDRLFRGF